VAHAAFRRSSSFQSVMRWHAPYCGCVSNGSHRRRMNEMREALMYDAMRGTMQSIPYFVLKVSVCSAASKSTETTDILLMGAR
jgi:hypothetical protein